MSARIGPAWVAIVRGHARRVDTPAVREAYRRGDSPRAELVRDLERRHRWDTWHAIPREVRYAVADAHPGLTDAHLDTMLRAAVLELGGG